MTRRFALALVAAAILLLGLAGSATAAPLTAPGPAAPSAAVPELAAAPALGPDCNGDPPLPSNPYGHIAVRPAIVADGDPFSDPNVSIQSVYGTNYKWWNYDNGCSPQDGIMPSLGANLGNLIGLELPGLLPSWGQGLFTLVVDPSGWIGSLDTTVASVTASTAAGTWFPWLSVAMTIVAIVTLLRARSGQLSGSINAVAWALLVLVVTSWAVSYPVESVKLLDDGVQTAVVAIADGFDKADFVGPVAPQSTQDKATAAKQTLDRQWDTLTRETVFRSWAEGVFGDADGVTARTYGPDVFAATHFTWNEYDTYAKDPAGAGARIVAAKAQAFRQLADKIQQDDPVAYDYFTGNKWGERITTALLSFVSVLTVALFLVVAGIFVLGAYVLIRLLLPLTPVAGVVFLVDSTRDMALGLFKKVVKPLVMGPIYFLAALVVLRYNVGVLRSNLPDWLKLVLVFLVAYLAWRLLRPTAVLPKMKFPGRFLPAYLGTRVGTERGKDADDARDKQPGPDGIPPSGPQRQHPVHYPAAVPPSSEALFVAASRTPEYAGELTSGPALRGTGRGTFAPREQPVAGLPSAEAGRIAREASGGTRSTFAQLGSGAGEFVRPSGPSQEPYLGRHATPLVAREEPQRSIPDLVPVGSREGLSRRTPLGTGAVEGRVLDDRETAVTSVVDDSNLTYDSAGQRVFVVFSPARNHAEDGSLVES
ncbi:hypothetical protein ACWEOW_02875 [Monashia sp. NPDC004114]